MPPKIEFDYDEPMVLHLCETQGRLVDNRWEAFSVQYFFIAEEGVFYLSDTAGGLLNARLRARGVQPGQPITITKVRVPNPNSERPVTEYFPRICQEVAQ